MTPSTEEQAASPARRLSRREAIAVGAAGAAATALAATGSAAAADRGRYPRLLVADIASLKRNTPVTFNYPLAKQPNVLIDFGREVPAGVGPRASIVAYSILCQHMGCPVEYKPARREFFCPCHQSRYDPERLGSIIQGLAMQPLPRVHLEVADGGVWATGVDGLIYGYRNNLVPGARAGGGS